MALWDLNHIIYVAQFPAFMLHELTIVFIYYLCGTGLFIKCVHILYSILLQQPSKISRNFLSLFDR